MPLTHRFSVDSVVEEGRTTREAIGELKTWLSTQNYPKLTDQQIVLFLLSCDSDQASTRKTIREHYKAKINGPGLFSNRYVDREEVQKQIKTGYCALLPKRTPDGCNIIYYKLRDTLYSNFCIEPAIKMLFMVYDLGLQGPPPTGLIIVFDMDGVGLMHISRLRIEVFKKLAHFAQEGLSMKLKCIYIIHSFYIADKILAIIKPFLKKELWEKISIHPISCDMEEFFEKHIPADCLPVEFGGKLPSVDQLHEETFRQVRQLEPYFEAEEKQRKESL